jgi:ubiquinol-cytochrome c reductase cytochrome b subunit
MLKDALFSALAVIVVVVLAVVLGPKGPTGPPDPTLPGANPRPEWPFLWLFGLLSLSPSAWETFIMLVFPIILIVVLFLVPFVSNRGERAPSRRPVAVLAVIVIYAVLGDLTYEGLTSPWSPQMTAWSGDPVPEELVRSSSPLGLKGAAVFQSKDCRNCHALMGSGGRRGPDLTAVGTRLTRDQLIVQVSNGTPGGGDMPAYGRQISPAEMTALVEFLKNLLPAGAPGAEPADRRTPEKEYP